MININALERDLQTIRRESPLIHNITNLVVMNNTANALLAIGASPVMSHAIEEVKEMTLISGALVINIGTLDGSWVEAMITASTVARANNIPVVFDPVGAGATSYRNRVCKEILDRRLPDVIRGNASEMMALGNTTLRTKGVDSTRTPLDAMETAQQLARNTGAVIVVSGQTDFITDGCESEFVHYGHPLMSKVTGMGCTSTAIVAAFAAVNSKMFLSATHAMTVMGIVGELAAQISHGNGSMQINFLDQLSNLDNRTWISKIR
jgi:hydroxyethylthiazole kinase